MAGRNRVRGKTMILPCRQPHARLPTVSSRAVYVSAQTYLQGWVPCSFRLLKEGVNRVVGFLLV